MTYFTEIRQHIRVSAGNTSTDNLAGAATFTGTAEYIDGAVGLSVTLAADQNCAVYVDHSMDGVNFLFTDTFQFYASKVGDSWAVQAVYPYIRVRVTNQNPSVATTTFNLETNIVPIGNALPRTLTTLGNLKVAVREIESEFDVRATITPMGGQEVTQIIRLIGGVFTVAGALDTNFWTVAATATATATVATRVATLATNPTGTGTGNDVLVTSNRAARYVGGAHNYYRGVIRVPAATGAVTKRWGCFDANDGYYFAHDGTTLSLYSRSATTDSAPISSGSFNGTLGSTLTLDANVHTYEIHYTNRTAWFMFDGNLLHKLSATTTPHTSTLHFRTGAQVTNGGANNANNTLEIWTNTINRAGQLMTQPKAVRISTTTTTILKLGPGVIHSIVFGSLPSAAGTITMYDNTSAAGSPFYVATVDTTATAVKLPVSVDFKGYPFSTGLTIVTATNASDFTVIYE